MCACGCDGRVLLLHVVMWGADRARVCTGPRSMVSGGEHVCAVLRVMVRRWAGGRGGLGVVEVGQVLGRFREG